MRAPAARALRDNETATALGIGTATQQGAAIEKRACFHDHQVRCYDAGFESDRPRQVAVPRLAELPLECDAFGCEGTLMFRGYKFHLDVDSESLGTKVRMASPAVAMTDGQALELLPAFAAAMRAWINGDPVDDFEPVPAAKQVDAPLVLVANPAGFIVQSSALSRINKGDVVEMIEIDGRRFTPNAEQLRAILERSTRTKSIYLWLKGSATDVVKLSLGDLHGTVVKEEDSVPALPPPKPKRKPLHVPGGP